MKTLFKNAKIFTADSSNPYAEVMLVEDGRITFVGAEEALPEAADQIIDLQGTRVIPGFIDAHMHPVMLADFSQKISALPPAVNSIEELSAAIAKVRETQEAGQWIEGWGYDEGKFSEHRAPNRYDLDKGCSDSPVSIVRTCGHIRCVNSKALELAGIDRYTADPEGGEIERDENGEPTGVLKETARDLILPYMPQEREEDTVRNLTALGELLISQGIVAICDMGNLDASDNYPLYIQAREQGFKQEVAIYYMWDYARTNLDFDLTVEKCDRSKPVFAAGLKLIGDGSVSGRTAWMSRPYKGSTDEYGIAVCSDEELETAIDFCKAHHCQLSVHAMGGKAIDRVVDRVASEEKWTEGAVPYARIEHVTDPSESSIQKAVKKQIAFVTQPIFMYAEIESYQKNLETDWMKNCYPVKNMIDAGVMLSFSTDAPATSWAVPSDPFPCIKGAVTRKAFDGTDCGQEQIIDVETAITLYTRESAKAAGFKNLGMLKAGYKANFAVLTEDILSIDKEAIDTISVQATYIHGECVYEK